MCRRFHNYTEIRKSLYHWLYGGGDKAAISIQIERFPVFVFSSCLFFHLFCFFCFSCLFLFLFFLFFVRAICVIGGIDRNRKMVLISMVFEIASSYPANKKK